MTIDVFKDLGYWLVFGVAIALAQLWLVQVAYYLKNQSVTWVQLVGNGSLLFFSTAITSKTAGEYFKKSKAHNAAATLICVTVMLGIILCSGFGYGVVISTHLGTAPTDALSADRVTTLSDRLAFAGIIFSGAFTAYLRMYGE